MFQLYNEDSLPASLPGLIQNRRNAYRSSDENEQRVAASASWTLNFIRSLGRGDFFALELIANRLGAPAGSFLAFAAPVRWAPHFYQNSPCPVPWNLAFCFPVSAGFTFFSAVFFRFASAASHCA